jgi:WD40 repeat protein
MLIRRLVALAAILCTAAEPRLDRHGDPLPPGAIARLGTVRFRHGDVVSALAYSPDGKTLASASQDGTLVFWDAGTGKERQRIEGSFNKLVYFRNGARLAAFGDGSVLILDAATGKLRQIVSAPPKEQWNAFALAPDGKSFATGTRQAVRVYDVDSGREIDQFFPHPGVIDVLAFSPDGKHLALSGANTDTQHELILWDVAARKEVRRLRGHSHDISHIAFTPNGKTLVTTSRDLSGRLWDVATGQERTGLDNLQQGVGALAISPDGRELITALKHRGYGPNVRRWRTESGKELEPLDHLEPATALAYSPDGKTLAVGGNGTIRRFDVALRKEIDPPDGHRENRAWAVWSPDGRTIATSGADWTIRFWDAARGRQLFASPRQDSEVMSVAFTPNGKAVAAVFHGSDAVHVLDVNSGRVEHRFGGSKGFRSHSVAFSPDGESAVLDGDENTLTVWDPRTGKLRHTVTVEPDRPGEENIVTLMTEPRFSPDGRFLAAIAYKNVFVGIGDPKLRVWETATWRELPLFDEQGPRKDQHVWITSPTFAPDGRTIAAIDRDHDGKQCIRIWEIATGRTRRVINDVPRNVHGVHFSPDGRYLVLVSLKVVVFLDAQTGKEVGRLAAPGVSINEIAFSPDGRRIVTCGEGAPLVWELSEVLNH